MASFQSTNRSARDVDIYFSPHADPELIHVQRTVLPIAYMSDGNMIFKISNVHFANYSLHHVRGR